MAGRRDLSEGTYHVISTDHIPGHLCSLGSGLTRARMDLCGGEESHRADPEEVQDLQRVDVVLVQDLKSTPVGPLVSGQCV